MNEKTDAYCLNERYGEKWIGNEQVKKEADYWLTTHTINLLASPY